MKNLLKAFLRAIFRLAFRMRVEGRFEMPADKRLLIIANHESLLDGLLLGLFLPVEAVFVVHTGVTRVGFFRLVLSLSDYLSVDPTSPMAMKKVVKLIESGRPVVIFPEGRITVTGSLMKVYEGPAFIAARTGATILPVRLDGATRTYFSRMSGQYPRRLFPRITLSILPPTRLNMPVAPTAKLRRRRAGEQMRLLMQHMVFSARPNQTLYSAFLSAMEIHGRRRHMVEDIKQIEYSYRDLLKMALALGRVAAKVSREGENVGLLMPNLAATAAMIVGMSALRRVPALLNYTAGTEGMQNACAAASVQTVITVRQFVESAKLEEVVGALKGVKVLYLEDLTASLGFFDKLWVGLLGLGFPRAMENGVQSEDPAVVLFTSGSEGKPKGVVLSHRAILANIAQVRAVIDFSVGDKMFNALPMFHSFGLTAGTLLPLLSGASLFLYPTPLHYRLIPELVYDRNCTILLGTSTFLGNYAKFAHPYDFYSLRYVIAGAEKLSDAVRNQWFEKFGLRILEGYGATETAPVLAVNTPMAYRTGTVGQLLPGIEARVVPVPGIEGGGLLHVRGPNLMSGYYRCEHPGVIEPPAADDLGPGWYNTGDVVQMDDDGFVAIKGRVKRFAKVAGEMVSLEVVEKIATAASPEALHGASTQSDPQRGENIVLFTTDDGLTRERLQDAARAQGYPELAVPRKICKTDSLPLLGTGKVVYVTLKKLAENL